MDVNNEKDGENATKDELPVIDSQELDEADINAIKGDRIGDTVYSAKWIINTLISLSQVYEDGCSQALEDNLCILWDMTTEKDIVDFLMDNDFLRIGEFTLKTSEEPRLTEIILGIISNMCCHSIVLEAVANTSNLVSTVFGLLSSDDAQTLVQVLRLLQAAVWKIRENKQSEWLQLLKNCEFIGAAISFILQSSTNDELLIAALELVQSLGDVQMSDDKSLLSDLFTVEQLVPAIFESFKQLIPTKHDSGLSHTELKVVENWLSIFSNILQSEFRTFFKDTSDDNHAILTTVFLRILQPYRSRANLVPLEEKVAMCINECVEMVSWFQRNKMYPDGEIVRAILAIMHGFRCVMKTNCKPDSFINPNETIQEVIKYLENYWFETVRVFEENEILDIIKECDIELRECLMEVVMEYSKESQDIIEKLSRIISRINDSG